eukprot:TRINITY_DN27897_c0_g2_i1.p1 TRINITY_DN27897_c0_g2~~TRINITY_DN27897_c0_g2_i1.p1  ORF type:complete len:481 (-),score=39.24 TRINITY_DN27897_c0_g2_i1:57-1499(-)
MLLILLPWFSLMLSVLGQNNTTSTGSDATPNVTPANHSGLPAAPVCEVCKEKPPRSVLDRVCRRRECEGHCKWCRDASVATWLSHAGETCETRRRKYANLTILDWWRHWKKGATTLVLIALLSPIVAFAVPVVYRQLCFTEAEKRDTQNYWATHSNILAWTAFRFLAGGSFAVVMVILAMPLVFGPMFTKFGCNDVSSHILFCVEGGEDRPDVAVSTFFFCIQVMKTLTYLYQLLFVCHWENSDDVVLTLPGFVQFVCMLGCVPIIWCYKFGLFLRDGKPSKAADTGEVVASQVWGVGLAADAYILLLASATAWNSPIRFKKLCEGGLASLDRIYSATFPVWLWFLWLLLFAPAIWTWSSAYKTDHDHKDGFRLLFVREAFFVRLPTVVVLVVTVLVKAPMSQFMLYAALDTFMAILRLTKQLCFYRRLEEKSASSLVHTRLDEESPVASFSGSSSEELTSSRSGDSSGSFSRELSSSRA